MKTLVLPLLALAAAGGLVAVGFAPETRSEVAPPREEFPQPVIKPPPPPEPLPPPFFTLQPGPPAPFDPTRPIHVRVPDGYDGVPAGDYQIRPSESGPNSFGAWMMGGRRNLFTINVTQVMFGGARHTQLHLIYDYQPAAFSDSRLVGADGVIRPGVFPPGNPAGLVTRFPNAAGPWVVYQP